MTMTGKLVHEETREDWDERFNSFGWQQAGGNIQSLLFMHAIVKSLLNSPIKEMLVDLSRAERKEGIISGHAAVIHDYGCAEGDGTAFLQSIFPLSRVTGFDWSVGAIERAQKRWPTISFKVGDITDPKEPASIIFTSHTMEHLENPEPVLRHLLNFCHFLIVAVPTIRKTGDKGGHEGALPTEEWLESVPYLYKDEFATCRGTDDSDVFIMEGTYLYVYGA